MNRRKLVVLVLAVAFHGAALAADLFIDADIDRHARAWASLIDAGDPSAAWEAASPLDGQWRGVGYRVQ